MFDKLFDELIYEDKLGETWRLELAPNHSKYSISSRKSGSEKWAKSIARKLTEKEKDDFKFIGIYSEGETNDGPIVDGYIFHCTDDYLKSTPHLHKDKRNAIKQHIKTGKVIEYFED